MRHKTQLRLRDRIVEGYSKTFLAKKLGYKNRQSINNLLVNMSNKQARQIQEKAIERQELFGDSVVDMCSKR